MDTIGREQGGQPAAGAGSSEAALELDQKIAENDKQIEKLYSKIGDVYCQKHETDAEPDLKEYVDSVRQLQKQNEDWTDQIRNGYGMVKCGKCGSYVEKGSVFCGFCGERLVPKNESGCPNCGAELKEGFAFCPVCGTPVQKKSAVEEKTETETKPAPKAGPEPEPEAEPEPKAENNSKPVARRCRKCGAELRKDDIFCIECGTPVEDEPEPDPAAQGKPKSAPGKKKCPGCGADLEADDVFCIECGTKVG